MPQLPIGFENSSFYKSLQVSGRRRRRSSPLQRHFPPSASSPLLHLSHSPFMLALAGSCAAARQRGFERQPPRLQRLLLACALACALLLHSCVAAPLVREEGDSTAPRACVKYALALESALQRRDEARAQQIMSDFFSTLRAAPLKRCFLFRAGAAFHSLGDSASCWTMFSAFFDAFRDHERDISAGSAYAASYAKGGTCAAIEGHTDAATTLLRRAVHLQPLDSQSWNNLANVYRSAGLTQQALDA